MAAASAGNGTISRWCRLHALLAGAPADHLPDDLVEILADGTGRDRGEPARLCYRFDGKEQDTCLDDSYELGTPYEVTLTVADGVITIGYEGRTVATERHTGSGNYFKTGAYTQSNPDRGDEPGAYGEVLLHSASVRHS